MQVVRRIVRVTGLMVLCVSTFACALMPDFGSKRVGKEQLFTLRPNINVAPVERGACGSVEVGAPVAAPGFQSSRMVYSVQPFELKYFAYSRWADSFARLLQDPLQSGLVAQRGFNNVLTAPSVAPTNYRVEMDNVSLVQRLDTPQSTQSKVELTANLSVFTLNPNQLLVTKNFRLSEPARATPTDGVAAANTLVAKLVGEVAVETYKACKQRQ